MDTQKRLGIKKSKAIMLFVQMLLTIFLLVISVYLLVFVISNNLGGWMISSYVLVILSVLTVICYGAFGFRKGDLAYKLAILPFLGAVLVNTMMPNREPFQIALLAVLFALLFVFLFKQEDQKFTSIISFVMVGVALTFSIYSSIKADVSFVGEISKSWPTYVAMYTSIFVPTIMTTTFALTYNVRCTRTKVAADD